MNKDFPGFPEDTLEFLSDLANNNNKMWFDENKIRYTESVVTPMLDLITTMAPRLEMISNCFIADPRRNGGSMFRIYRDARFSKNKKPYKENAGCQFRHEAGKDAHAPGFYIHIEPNNVFIGGGVWQPPTSVLNAVRQRIVEKPEEWRTALSGKPFLDLFGDLTGDSLKRPPRGFDQNHPYINDLKRKSFMAVHPIESELINTPHFINIVEDHFSALSPLMKFITLAMGLPYQR